MKGYVASLLNVADEIVDLRTLSLPSLDQLHYSHQMNNLLLGMSSPIECADE
jgi:hypothetical protein